MRLVISSVFWTQQWQNRLELRFSHCLLLICATVVLLSRLKINFVELMCFKFLCAFSSCCHWWIVGFLFTGVRLWTELGLKGRRVLVASHSLKVPTLTCISFFTRTRFQMINLEEFLCPVLSPPYRHCVLSRCYERWTFIFLRALFQGITGY